MAVEVSLNGKLVDANYENCQVFYRFLDAGQVQPPMDCDDVKGCWEKSTGGVQILVADSALDVADASVTAVERVGPVPPKGMEVPRQAVAREVGGDR